MRTLSAILLLPLTLALSSCPPKNNPVKTFEFGTNVGRYVFSKSGDIDHYEKIIGIKVKEPECKTLTYVRVDVNNPDETPNVTYNPESGMAIIKYTNPRKDSSSTYTVAAKAVPIPYCGMQHEPVH